MVFACGDNKIFGLFVLQHQPHTLDIIFRIAPVAPRIHIAEVQLILQALLDACYSQRNLARNEGFAATLAFVIEEDAINGIHAITLAIVFDNPKTILFGHAVGRARIEGRCLSLRHFLHLSIQFGCTGLIKAGLLLHTQNAYRFK